jgi:hypothetical protein
MRRNKRRQLELGIIALGLSTLALLWLVLAIGFWQYANAESVIIASPTPPQSRPAKCAHLRVEPDPSTWDAQTDSYPRNEAWEECMGVGRR